MSETNNHIQFSVTDIEKYWKGELPATTMHAMEKAAMDDPFLADAMDGYKNKVAHKKEPVAPDIQELRKRLQESVEKDKVVAMPSQRANWWKVAAAAVILIGGSVLTFQFINNTNQQPEKNIAVVSPAQNETTTNTIATADSVKQSTNVVSSADSITSNTDIALNNTTNKPVIGNKNATELFSNTEQLDTSLANTATDAIVKNNTPVVASPATSELAKEAEVKSDFAKKDADKSDPKLGAVRKSLRNDDTIERKKDLDGKNPGDNHVNVFSGRVINQNNQPVAGAIVRVPARGQTTSTDANGSFNFSSPDSIVTASITSVGYETQNLSLRNSNVDLSQYKQTRERQSNVDNQIQLRSQNAQLNEEVVVSGYGTKRDRKLSAKTKGIDVDVLEASPLVRADEYNNYLEKNKVLTDEVKNIHGTVVVSFTVTKKGLTDFKIEQSLNHYLDAEAIRLVKEGPGWKLTKGKKARASVMVNF
jgi:anti-sigma-K factor RskA